MQSLSASQVQNLAQDLDQGIKALGLDISQQQQSLLMAYFEQLLRWNQAYNLSGIKDPQRMLTLHLLDSLSVLPFINGKVILDVGTGAGLPGFPLAICCPDKNFYLLDSNGKKTRFMFQTASLLKMENISVAQSRIEDYKCPEVPDIVLSRAFSSLKQFASWTRHLLAEQSKLLAMKGVYPEAEIAELPEGFAVKNCHVLSLPGEHSQRHLLEITRV